ncbi:Uroporphyrinogen decarboxylase [Thalassocella blandensis]|nr:Uroporphyrinogen decarboxylase [Thalassocella blandensis]
MDLCKNPDFACEVTLQPLQRFPLDAAILFSDILTIPDAMGQGLYFVEGEGPRFRKIIEKPSDVEKLKVIDANDDLSYVIDAVKAIRYELNGKVPLIGFSGSPWTLATYMIEGKSSRDFHRVKTFMYQQPNSMHQLLSILSKSVISYLNAQIMAGAQVVQIFDTWGGILSNPAYQNFSLSYMKTIIDNLKNDSNGNRIPVILFTKGGGQWLDIMASTGTDAIGLDWTTDIGEARRKVGNYIALQGNMDPSVLFASREDICIEVRRILERFGHGSGHIFNLGHGISQFANPEQVAVFIEAIHKFSMQYHSRSN